MWLMKKSENVIAMKSIFFVTCYKFEDSYLKFHNGYPIKASKNNQI